MNPTKDSVLDDGHSSAPSRPRPEEKQGSNFRCALNEASGQSSDWRSRLKFDEEDRHLVEGIPWQLNGKKDRDRYASMRSGGTKVYLHILIAGSRPGMVVDHKNGDTLDNRRENLRHVPNGTNIQNQHRNRGSSQFQGVTFVKKPGTWYAKITHHYVQYGLGRYRTDVEAAAVYDAAARILFGVDAKLNLPAEPSAEAMLIAQAMIARYRDRLPTDEQTALAILQAGGDATLLAHFLGGDQ